MRNNPHIKIAKEKLNQITDNFVITKHAIERLEERFPEMIVYLKNGKISYYLTVRNVARILDDYILAYTNTDGSVNVAINKYEYFVFAKDIDKWVLITFKEKSNNNVSIFKKYMLAKSGYERR